MANIYKNEKKDLTTNTVTTLYSVPSNSRAIIKSLFMGSFCASYIFFFFSIFFDSKKGD